MLGLAVMALALAGVLQLVAISRSYAATRQHLALLTQPLTVEELQRRNGAMKNKRAGS